MWTSRMACPLKSPILMRATFGAEVNPIKFTLLAVLLLSPALQNSHATTRVQRDDSLKAAHEAYEAGEYAKAAQLLQAAALQNPRDGEIHLFLAKTYYEPHQNHSPVVSPQKPAPPDPQ